MIRKCDCPPASADINQADAIMKLAFPPEFGEAWTRAQLSDSLRLPGMQLWLVENSTRAIGQAFALVRTILDESELMLIAVHPDARRKGVASRLLPEITKDLKKNGAARLFLEVRENNPAKLFYTKHDFDMIGIRKSYYAGRNGQKYDAITYQKLIF